jgi:hypothetical protein
MILVIVICLLPHTIERSNYPQMKIYTHKGIIKYKRIQFKLRKAFRTYKVLMKNNRMALLLNCHHHLNIQALTAKDNLIKLIIID